MAVAASCSVLAYQHEGGGKNLEYASFQISPGKIVKTVCGFFKITEKNDTELMSYLCSDSCYRRIELQKDGGVSYVINILGEPPIQEKKLLDKWPVALLSVTRQAESPHIVPITTKEQLAFFKSNFVSMRQITPDGFTKTTERISVSKL